MFSQEAPGQGKVQMEAWMFGQPDLDPGMFVRGIVIQDQVQFMFRGAEHRPVAGTSAIPDADGGPGSSR